MEGRTLNVSFRCRVMKSKLKILAIALTVFNATTVVAEDGVAPGPVFEKRKQVYDYLLKAKKAGVGTTPYEKALADIESDVKAGKSEEEISKHLSSLTTSLAQQVRNFKAMKAAPPAYQSIRPTGSSSSSGSDGHGHGGPQPAMSGTLAAGARRANTGELESYMVTLVNKHRKQAGLGSLAQDSTLSTIARGHAADMIKRKFFDHVNPSGEDPRDRAKAGGYSGWVRENIAYTIYNLPGPVLVEMADKDLMNSPGHKKNILDDSGRSVGIGIVYDSKGGISVCQLFSP